MFKSLNLKIENFLHSPPIGSGSTHHAETDGITNADDKKPFTVENTKNTNNNST